MDGEAWCAAVHGVERFAHDWVTELNWYFSKPYKELKVLCYSRGNFPYYSKMSLKFFFFFFLIILAELFWRINRRVYLNWEAWECLWSSFNSAVLITPWMECKKQAKSNIYNIQYLTKLAIQKSIDIPITWLLILNSYKNQEVQLLTSNSIPNWITNVPSVRASKVVLQA